MKLVRVRGLQHLQVNIRILVPGKSNVADLPRLLRHQWVPPPDPSPQTFSPLLPHAPTRIPRPRLPPPPKVLLSPTPRAPSPPPPPTETPLPLSLPPAF